MTEPDSPRLSGSQRSRRTKSGTRLMPAAPVTMELPKAFSTLVSPEKTFLYSPAEVEENRAAWIEEWLGAMSR